MYVYQSQNEKPKGTFSTNKSPARTAISNTNVFVHSPSH